MHFYYRYFTIFFLGFFSILSCSYAMEENQEENQHKNVLNQQSIVIGSGWNNRRPHTQVGK